MNHFERGVPRDLPPEIKELIDKYGSLRNIPIERSYHTSAGEKVVRLTVQEWMTAFCPEDPSEVSDESFNREAINFILGEGHGEEIT